MDLRHTTKRASQSKQEASVEPKKPSKEMSKFMYFE